MSRLIDADSLALFPNNPESGTDDMINSWIEECGLSNLELYITEDCPVDVEHALKDLCWKVIQGYINVVETEPTAYDVGKVVEQLEVLKDLNHKEWKKSSWTGEEIMPYLFAHNSYVKAIKIVKAGGKCKTNMCIDCSMATYSQGRPYCEKEERHLDSFSYKPDWCSLKVGGIDES